MTVRANNRVLVAEGKAGSLATFPPPHVFFFTREVDTNLGYVWYRKDGDDAVRLGRSAGRRRRRRGVRRQLRALQRASGNTATHGRVLLRQPGRRPSRRARRSRLHPRRPFQADCRLQDDGEPLPSAVHGASARAGSLDNAIQDLMAMRAAGYQHRRPQRLPWRPPRHDPGPLRLEDQRDYARGLAEGVRQGLSRHAVGRAERVLRRALQHPVPEERVLDDGVSPASRSPRT